MSSPPRRRHKSAPMEEIQGAVPVPTTQQRLLPELDAPPASSRGSSISSAETNEQTCGEGDLCPGAPETRQYLELDKLPEDMLHHIHSLIPLQDAARVASVSRPFLRSWRCYSNLTLNWKTLGLLGDTSFGSEKRYINRVDQILNNYSGHGMKVKTLKIDLLYCRNVTASYLNRWLQIAVTSGINELSLLLCSSMKEKYCFPCSVLADEITPIQSLCLWGCTFPPIETLGCFRRLKSLNLVSVHITEEGLQQLLSKSSGLERLQIYSCSQIIFLTIPCTLLKLKLLTVKTCQKIQVLEISAPILSTFHYNGFPLEINIRDPSQLKDVYLSSSYPSRILSYGRAKLPSIAPNVERLTLRSRCENVNTPMLPDKLLHLKSLEIKLQRSGCSSMYDLFSVVSFLDASPVLESFVLHVQRDSIVRDCVAGDDLYLRRESAYQHDHLRRVKIMGFHSTKSLIKLVIHILESAPSLESLTLDMTRGYGRNLGDTSNCTASGESGKCCLISERDLKGADGDLRLWRTSLVEFPQLLDLRCWSPVGDAMLAIGRWMLVGFFLSRFWPVVWYKQHV